MSGEVEAVGHEIFLLVNILGEIDVILAKAKYGQAEKCTMPQINNNGYIRLVKARHPLISVEQAVPNTIEFGKDITAIVITGPNTGGKPLH